MENKFKYRLVFFLLIAINGLISAMAPGRKRTASVDNSSADDGRVADIMRRRIGTAAALIASGTKPWDGSSSLPEFSYRDRVRSDLKTAFGAIFTDHYVSSVSQDKFVADFNSQADSIIKPYLVERCHCCPRGNKLIYQYMRTALLDTALQTRAAQISLISTNRQMWHLFGDFFIPVAPLDVFAFEGERAVNKQQLAIYATAKKIQTAFRGHRAGLHARAYEARVTRFLDASRKDAAATKIQAVMRGAQVRHQLVARVEVV